MKRLAFLIALVAGCSHKPCAVTSECGDGESCVAAHCQALSCSDTIYAVNPATGTCTPLSGCVDHTTVDGWKPCDDPCAGLDESACKSSTTCQATYATDGQPFGCGDTVSCPVPGSFRSCRAVPQLVDPCLALDATSCQRDSRCEVAPQPGCACDAPPSADGGTGVCDCGGQFPSCRLKQCDLLRADECSARPDCTSTPVFVTPIANGGSGGSTGGATGSGTAQPQLSLQPGCFFLGGCNGVPERDCLMQHACVPLYTPNGSYTGCAAQDFTRHCTSSADCHSDERCNADGRCVVAGCSGENEVECNADLHCEPIYSLSCSPYANGPNGGGSFCGPNGLGGGGAPLPNELPAPGSCTCEPSFSGCQPASSGCDTGKSVLIRDPAILDDPFWALPRVLGLVTGSDANLVADGWLGQLATSVTIDGKVANARTGAAQFLAALPHRSDGTLDASKLGFVPTSLSNRIDLADSGSCGEARITYALSVGVSDRRHRMTVIVELRQPYDGARCHTIAGTWVGLSKLDGAALQAALQAIYTPLLTPSNLKQVRTNEFLVGPDTGAPQAWELREFHLGADARLHQVLLPLQIDPAAVAAAPDFVTWANANSAGLQRGTVTFPAQYQLPTGSEDGTRVTLNDPALADLVNKSTCAGCHTTATNSAFAHVGERFRGTGRAEISQFLEGELQKRARHLALVASGAADAVLDVKPLH